MTMAGFRLDAQNTLTSFVMMEISMMAQKNWHGLAAAVLSLVEQSIAETLMAHSG